MRPALQPYPEYKDSGVPWLGPIPAHWSVRRGKRLFQRMQRPVRDADETVTCFRDGVVTLRLNRRTGGFTESLKEIGYQGVRQGDLVIHAMDAFAGAVGVSDSDGKCTPVYSICQPTGNANTHYYAYVVREMARTRYLEALARGIRERSSDFRFDTFASQPLPIPPFDEQQAIATFIIQVDRLTRRYIHAQQTLIALLEELKQAIIQQAVTRGLDPDVPLKPSGIGWLGEIPEHWEVRRLRYIGDAIIGLTYEPKDVVDARNGILVLRASNVVGGHIVLDDSIFVRCTVPERLIARAGDILICSRSGSRALIGKNARINGEAVGMTFGTFMTMFRSQYNDYLSYVFNSKLFEYQSGAFLTSTINQLTLRSLYGFTVPLPSDLEQSAIVRFLQAETTSIASAIDGIQQRIALIREYRTRLISDVVTGRLDVRHAAADLPAEVEESECWAADEADGKSEDAQ